MALESTVIAKIVGGITAVGASGGAGVYAYQTGVFNSLFNDSVIEVKPTENSYLIIKATELSTEKSKLLISGKNRNHNCLISDKQKDKVGCLISEVSFSADKKTAEISSLNSLKVDITQDIKLFSETGVVNKYYKLQMNDESLKNFDIKSDKTIDIVGLDSTKFAKLVPQFKVTDGKVETKNDYFLSVSSPTSDSSTAAGTTFINYECTMDTHITEKTKCIIYKFTTPKDGTSEISDINFGEANLLTEIKASTEITDSKLHIIKLINPTITGKIDEWKNKNILFKYYENPSKEASTSAKTYTFNVKARLFGNVSNPSEGIFIFEK